MGRGITLISATPGALRLTSTGNVYVADRSNFCHPPDHSQRPRQHIRRRGTLTGHADGPGAYARFHRSLAAWRLIPRATSMWRTPATAVYAKSHPPGLPREVGDGGAKPASSSAQCLAVDSLDNLYVLDGDVIRKMTPAGEVTALPKTALRDGQGNLHSPPLAWPSIRRAIFSGGRKRPTPSGWWRCGPAALTLGVNYKNVADGRTAGAAVAFASRDEHANGPSNLSCWRWPPAASPKAERQSRPAYPP